MRCWSTNLTGKSALYEMPSMSFGRGGEEGAAHAGGQCSGPVWCSCTNTHLGVSNGNQSTHYHAVRKGLVLRGLVL